MGVIIAIGVVLVSIVGAALSQQLTDEIKAWTPWLVDRLIKAAIVRIPEEGRARLYEEWHGHVEETPGHIGKLWNAAGFLIASYKIEALLLKIKRDDRDDTEENRESERQKLMTAPDQLLVLEAVRITKEQYPLLWDEASRYVDRAAGRKKSKRRRKSKP